VRTSRSFRVVIAEHDPWLRSYLRTQLVDLGYVVVGAARDGQEAMSLARQVHPDLIVMDIEMPNLDGLEASRQIDLEGICPIILLGAYTDRAVVRKACSLLAVQGYLVKPVTARDVEPAVEVAIRRFQRLKHLQRRGTQPDRSAGGCSILERAIECLAADHHRSPQEAYGWLLQEAMAEKVVVERLAWEIAAGSRNCSMPVSGDS